MTFRVFFAAIIFVAIFSGSAFAKSYEFSAKTVDGYSVTGTITCVVPDSQIQVNVEEFIMTSVYRTDIDGWIDNMNSFSDNNCTISYSANLKNPFPGYTPENETENEVVKPMPRTVDDFMDADDF